MSAARSPRATCLAKLSSICVNPAPLRSSTIANRPNGNMRSRARPVSSAGLRIGSLSLTKISASPVLPRWTYHGNPLGMAAARASLLEVLTPDAYAHLDHLNDRILAGCGAVVEQYGLPGYAVG